MKAAEIVRRAAGPAVATDGKDRISSWNRDAEKLLGFTRGQRIVGKSFHDLITAQDVSGNRLSRDHIPFYDMVTHGEAVTGFKLVARRASGETIRVAVSVIVVLAPEPSEYELVYMLRPILRRRKADEALERLLAAGVGTRLSSFDSTAGSDSPSSPELTRRQLEVLRLLTRGKSTGDIAASLHLSVHTVRRHIQNILGKLKVHSQREAVSRAFRQHLV